MAAAQALRDQQQNQPVGAHGMNPALYNSMSFDQSADPSAGGIGHQMEGSNGFNEAVGGPGQPEVGADGQRMSPQNPQTLRATEKTSFWANLMKQGKAMGRIVFGSEFLNNIQSIMFLSVILSMITPVLGSLTATYANETIILDYAVFVFIHLIYYDFDLIN